MCSAKLFVFILSLFAALAFAEDSEKEEPQHDERSQDQVCKDFLEKVNKLEDFGEEVKKIGIDNNDQTRTRPLATVLLCVTKTKGTVNDANKAVDNLEEAKHKG